jgi:hypothetical protein
VVPAPVARRLARIVSGLIEAAAPQDPDQPVLVAAGSTQARLMVVVSESSGSKDRGRLALGAKPAALLSLLRQLNGSLVASPAVNGIGTDTILSVPLNRAELPND